VTITNYGTARLQVAAQFPTRTKKAQGPLVRDLGRYKALGDSLLSHGKLPHYHRRQAVSLPGSGWVRVGHARYGHQAVRCRRGKGQGCCPSLPLSRRFRPGLAASALSNSLQANARRLGRSRHWPVHGILYLARPAGTVPCPRGLLAASSPLRRAGMGRAPHALSLLACFIRPIGRYRVKPHGQLVRVSCTRRRASTPRLSTSWSRTALQGALGPGEVSSWEGLPA
jgi:hypothetical protein